MSNLIKVTRKELDNLIKIKGNIRDIDVSCVTDMSYMFKDINFNDWKDQSLCDITGWDTSKVKDMSFMFAGAESIYTIRFRISNWNTSKVKDMSFMFAGAKSFNQPIGDWDVGKVKDMSFMFA